MHKSNGKAHLYSADANSENLKSPHVFCAWTVTEQCIQTADVVNFNADGDSALRLFLCAE